MIVVKEAFIKLSTKLRPEKGGGIDKGRHRGDTGVRIDGQTGSRKIIIVVCRYVCSTPNIFFIL